MNKPFGNNCTLSVFKVSVNEVLYKAVLFELYPHNYTDGYLL